MTSLGIAAAGGAFGKPFAFPVGSPPGVTTHIFGKGRVVYISAPVGRRYFIRGLPELRKLLINAVDFVCGENPRLKIDAPSGVVANLTHAPDRNYLHLVNYTGTMHETSYAVEQIIPLHNLKISLRLDPGRKADKIYTLNKKKLNFRQQKDTISFILPVPGIHPCPVC